MAILLCISITFFSPKFETRLRLNLMVKFEGIIPPIVTFYDGDGGVDEMGIRSHVNFLIENGVHGIFTMGSTGEYAYLSDQERKKVVEITIDQVNGRVPVLAGISSPSLPLSVQWANHAEDCGADASIAILPAYFPVTEKQIISFFQELSKQTSLPLFLYNFPTVTHFDVVPTIIKTLAENAVIIGVKETIFSIEPIRELIEILNDREFIIFPGVDTLLKDSLELGAQGAILGSSNFAPKIHSQLYTAISNNDQHLLDQWYSKFTSIITTLLLYAANLQYSVALTKEILKARGHEISTSVRQPLPALKKHAKKKIQEAVRLIFD